ncbi:hypothetical protein HOP50_01g07220 [Chloropicon primus]|uniref:Uncharacterized protein n=1 Tax=Chloropicon primus TaxID=1764295 RepID=A0A5B8MFV3_9CHLO|nr:hypothetical protein A3770_01p07380 [Chloropicon primus]UPQ97431.1 hypothetical protein HOP50_01g07220 [Chloropicon primus]|eukprot:QDZ18220.1 hypothetical protein A3770_01p07380 [Chloropicon primus]
MSTDGIQAAVDAMVPIADQLRQGALYCEESFGNARNKAKVLEKTKTYTSQCLENFAGHVLNAMKEVDDLLQSQTSNVRKLNEGVQNLEAKIKYCRLEANSKMRESVSYEEDLVTNKVETLSTLESKRSVARENFDYGQLSRLGISAAKIFKSATEKEITYYPGSSETASSTASGGGGGGASSSGRGDSPPPLKKKSDAEVPKAKASVSDFQPPPPKPPPSATEFKAPAPAPPPAQSAAPPPPKPPPPAQTDRPKVSNFGGGGSLAEQLASRRNGLKKRQSLSKKASGGGGGAAAPAKKKAPQMSMAQELAMKMKNRK